MAQLLTERYADRGELARGGMGELRALWDRYGQPGQGRAGVVARPYTRSDAEAVLGEVAGDRRFAREFFRRYVRTG